MKVLWNFQHGDSTGKFRRGTRTDDDCDIRINVILRQWWRSWFMKEIPLFRCSPKARMCHKKKEVESWGKWRRSHFFGATKGNRQALCQRRLPPENFFEPILRMSGYCTNLFLGRPEFRDIRKTGLIQTFRSFWGYGIRAILVRMTELVLVLLRACLIMGIMSIVFRK